MNAAFWDTNSFAGLKKQEVIYAHGLNFGEWGLLLHVFPAGICLVYDEPESLQFEIHWNPGTLKRSVAIHVLGIRVVSINYQSFLISLSVAQPPCPIRFHPFHEFRMLSQNIHSSVYTHICLECIYCTEANSFSSHQIHQNHNKYRCFGCEYASSTLYLNSPLPLWHWVDLSFS